MKIKYYHFHLYYEFENTTIASKLREKIKQTFKIEVGRLWEKPVGPHPVCSCQVSVPAELFEKMTAWLLQNRNDIDFFIHPVTGNDIADHTDFIMWIGKSYKLNTEFFYKNKK